LLSVSRFSVDEMTECLEHFPILSLFMTYQQVCNKSNTMGATVGSGTAYHLIRVISYDNKICVMGCTM